MEGTTARSQLSTVSFFRHSAIKTFCRTACALTVAPKTCSLTSSCAGMGYGLHVAPLAREALCDEFLFFATGSRCMPSQAARVDSHENCRADSNTVRAGYIELRLRSSSSSSTRAFGCGGSPTTLSCVIPAARVECRRNLP